MIYLALLIALLAVMTWYLEFKAYSIPVLYYHHVEPADPITPEVFEAQMKYLLSKGYNSISLSLLYEFISGRGTVPRKSFVLTFDDGFYCNYHYLLPILKKYNLKATVFVVSGVRRQISSPGYREDARGYPSRMGTNNNASGRFAAWNELKLMTESGLVQVEDHSLFHDSIYISDRIEGFNTGVELDWPVWGDKRSGTVRYKTGSYLTHRNFTGDYKLNDYLTNIVKSSNLDPSDPKTMDMLKKAYRNYRTRNPVKFIYESEDGYRNRCREDIEKSKRLITEHTGANPAFFCFPWGQYNKTLLQILKKLGYNGAITTDKGANVKGGDPYRIKRFKVYRSNIRWFKRYFFLHRSRILVTLYKTLYGWF